MITEHQGARIKTRATKTGFVSYVRLGVPPMWQRVNPGIIYTTREWAERQAQWAIEDYQRFNSTKSFATPKRST